MRQKARGCRSFLIEEKDGKGHSWILLVARPWGKGDSRPPGSILDPPDKGKQDGRLPVTGGAKLVGTLLVDKNEKKGSRLRGALEKEVQIGAYFFRDFPEVEQRLHKRATTNSRATSSEEKKG